MNAPHDRQDGARLSSGPARAARLAVAAASAVLAATAVWAVVAAEWSLLAGVVLGFCACAVAARLLGRSRRRLIVVPALIGVAVQLSFMLVAVMLMTVPPD